MDILVGATLKGQIGGFLVDLRKGPAMKFPLEEGGQLALGANFNGDDQLVFC